MTAVLTRLKSRSARRIAAGLVAAGAELLARHLLHGSAETLTQMVVGGLAAAYELPKPVIK